MARNFLAEIDSSYPIPGSICVMSGNDSLDIRDWCDTVSDFETAATGGFELRRDGLISYEKSTQKLKLCKENNGAFTWVEIGKGTEVVNDLTTGGADKALSAEQGKSIKSQLDEMVNTKTNKTGVNRKCYLTIIDDDGRVELFTKMKPILDKHSVKISIAINPSFIGQPNYLSWEQLIQLKNEGHEIINHGWIGKEPSKMTLEEMKQFYIQEKAKFEEKNLGNGYNYYVYSGTQPISDSEIKNKIKNVYKCSFANSGNPQSYIPFDNYEVKRYPIQLSTVKQYIDFCIENSAYCVIMSHSYVEELTAEYLDDLLTYIINKGASIEYKSAKYMIDNFKNQFENGHTGGEYFLLDENGNVDFSIQGMSANEMVKNIIEISKKTNFPIEYFSDKDITEYTPNSITTEVIESAYAKKIGLPEAGTITTYRWYHPTVSSMLCFSNQVYDCFNSSEKWSRKWNQTRNRWDLFTPMNSVSIVNKPRFGDKGMSVFNTTLNLPIYCKTKGYTANKEMARGTTYNKWDVVYAPKLWANAICIQSGTTGVEEPPTWNSGTGKTTIDGGVIWEYVGVNSEWIKPDGTLVE